jgi:hypothetical protein
MKDTMKRGVALALLLVCLGACLMFAQVLPDERAAIIQNGVQVGEIYVPPQSDRGLYVEHWILYPNYVYPNARNGVKTEIVPIANPYTNEEDFFARAPFGPGYRYVEATCNDSPRFPRDASVGLAGAGETKPY